jgi:type II protein arginine methyltransferase
MKTLALDEFLMRVSVDPVALAHLAAFFFKMGDKTRARETALRALRAAPDDAQIRSLASAVLSEGIPRWHFALVRDEARNAAYEAALKRAVTAQTKVLEIGTGTGILAMMAARAGAQSVVTCEIAPAIAEAAREIIALNGFADRVQVVAKTSYDLDPDGDMDGPADVFVSEIVNSRLLGEDALPIVEHAVKFLLKPDAKIIPARGIVRIALACDGELHRARMGTISGFDLSPFNRLAANFHSIGRSDTRLRLLSEPVDLFDFDFQSGGPFPAATASKTLISTGGEANGIAQWIALQMDEEEWYENDPSPGASSAWSVIFWPFKTPRDCPAGMDIKVFGSHDRHRLRIWA